MKTFDWVTIGNKSSVGKGHEFVKWLIESATGLNNKNWKAHLKISTVKKTVQNEVAGYFKEKIWIETSTKMYTPF